MSEQILEIAPPQIITLAPEYDPQNADHVRRWELAGRPALDVADGDGQFWRPTITTVLQPDGSYQAIPAPQAPTVTEFEMAVQQTKAILAGREEQAKGDITDLKSRVAVTLVATGARMADNTLITADNVNAEGSRFVVWHAALISAYKDAGGNPEAGQALYDSIAGAPSKAAFPWLTDAVLAIFSATLLVESPAP